MKKNNFIITAAVTAALIAGSMTVPTYAAETDSVASASEATQDTEVAVANEDAQGAEVAPASEATQDTEVAVANEDAQGAEAAPASEATQDTEAAPATDTQDAATPLRVYSGFTYNHEWSDSAKRYLAESICPQVVLDEKTAEAYPGLAEAFSELNAEKKKSYTEKYQEILKDAEERLSEDPTYDTTFTDSGNYYVVRADGQIVSLVEAFSGYIGGAHGYEGYTGVNFDAASGKRLMLSDLVTDEAAFKEIVRNDITTNYPDVEPDLVEKYFANTPLNDMNWTAGYEGITCYFNAYTLGAYAIGEQIVVVPYAGNETLFADTAKNVPTNYGIEMPFGKPCKIGGRELLVFASRSKYDAYDVISIYVDGEEHRFDEDIYTYSVRPTYLKANGAEYIYLEYRIDDDYRALDIYKLGETPEHVGKVELGASGMHVDEPFISAKVALSDPDDLLLMKMNVILGTSDADRTYRVGTDGMPEATQDYYYYKNGKTLTSKVELTCKEVDEAGNATSDITLPAGTQMTLYRTDTESLADLRLDDGRLVRVDVDNKNYPQNIGGTDVHDIFEGVMFVG